MQTRALDQIRADLAAIDFRDPAIDVADRNHQRAVEVRVATVAVDAQL